jgi:3'(2'), 5'-bisphosphate nucleotidase
MSGLEEELKVACTAVQICSALTKRLQKETLGSDSAISKSDFSPVTIADFAAQALLTSAIHGAFKEDEFLAEESADELRANDQLLDKVATLVEATKSDYANAEPTLTVPSSAADVMDLIDYGGKNSRSDAPRTWVFDPIDGSSSHGCGLQCVRHYRLPLSQGPKRY